MYPETPVYEIPANEPAYGKPRLIMPRGGKTGGTDGSPEPQCGL
jgi:hypothetical protein